MAAAGPTAAHRRAQHLLEIGDIAGALEIAGANMEFGYDARDMITLYPSTCVVVEGLIRRGGDGDVDEAAATIDRLAAVSGGYTYQELALLRMRALLADASGDRAGYRGLRDRYRNMAAQLGFQGHLDAAQRMP